MNAIRTLTVAGVSLAMTTPVFAHICTLSMTPISGTCPVGNPTGTVIYVDDVAFIAPSTDRTDRGGDAMPFVYPDHWPFGSVAGVSWLIFIEMGNVNPFVCSTPDVDAWPGGLLL